MATGPIVSRAELDVTKSLLIDLALPLAHRANTDAEGHWAARVAALEALRDTFIAEGCEPRMAADRAILQVDSELEAQAAVEAAEAVRLAKARQRAADKALFHRAGGVEPRRVGSAWLVPSATTAGQVYRVVDGVCNCKAGESGKPCWHAALVEAVGAEPPTPQPPVPASIESRAARIARIIVEARGRLQAA